MSFHARQPFGFPGGEPGSGPPNGSYLNNLDFRLLRINVAAANAQPITKLPGTLTTNHFPSEADVTARWSTEIVRSGPPEREFAFDRKYFDMHVIDHVVKLGTTEAWTIANDRTFGHSFHVHDVQFKIVSRSDGPIADYEQGWKDTLYIPRSTSATIVAKFDEFASDTAPFMYHCHMANHEDGGLMGQFLVVKDPASLRRDANGVIRIAKRTEHPLTPSMIAAAESRAAKAAPDFQTTDLAGKPLTLASLTGKKSLVLLFIECDCPCSKEAAPFFDRVQAAYGNECTVVGVINADADSAATWAKEVSPRFPIVADPKLAIIGTYDARQSVYATIVTPGGTILKTYPGYNAATLKELAETAAK